MSAGGLGLAPTACDRLMPMHLRVGPDDRVEHVGPTLAKILGALGPGIPVVGARLEALVVLHHPPCAARAAALLEAGGAALELSLRAAPEMRLKGAAVPVALGPGTGAGTGALVNLSLGLSLIEATQRFGLSLEDFAATDLAAELLYLNEAKSALYEESRRLNRALEGARASALEQALTDTLTGLANRRALELDLRTSLGSPRPFALALFDLDYFKRVNDDLGHAAGDHVLCHVARILMEETRRGDHVARVGGDEFVVVFDDVEGPELPLRIARRIIDRLDAPILFEGRPCRVSSSVGISLSRHYATPAGAQMLHDADQALYAAKRAGRGRAEVFAPPLPGPPPGKGRKR